MDMEEIRRNMERSMKGMEQFMDEHATEGMSEDELNRLADQYMMQERMNPAKRVTEETASTADDFLELAENTENEARKRKYAEKALSLDPWCLDAELILTELNYPAGSDIAKRLARDEEVIRKGKEFIKEKGYETGDLWGHLEARPFMRALEVYAGDLVGGGFLRKAAAAYEEMLRCNENDNQGIRWQLIFLYVILEEEKKGQELFSRYNDFDEPQMLLGMSMLEYKEEKFDEAAAFLQRLLNVNPATKRFFRMAVDRTVLDSETLETISGRGGYRPFTIEELVMCYAENYSAFAINQKYCEWAERKLRGMKAAKKTAQPGD